jgi:SAM-dependent methyltransferase
MKSVVRTWLGAYRRHHRRLGLPAELAFEGGPARRTPPELTTLPEREPEMPDMPDMIAEPLRRYAKPSDFYLSARAKFFDENDALRQRAHDANAIYARQGARTSCKICGASLSGTGGFVSHGVPYVQCSDCGHLNGRHDDGGDFWEAMYVGEERDYAELYVNSAFEDRVRDIYLPKVDFLLEALPAGTEPALLDIGCGAGFFVDAALQRNVDAHGIDVNATMLEFGNDAIARQRGKRPLTLVSGTSFSDHMIASEAPVLSAIGVIEHLSDLGAFWQAFRSTRFEYFYFSVPMFSLSAVVEHVFAEVAPRHLQGEHTHLFTESSLQRMYGILGVEPVAEWRFGTDVMDLFRSLLQTVTANGSQDLREELISRFGPCIDDLQAVLDRAHYCSEIHVLTRRLKG